MHFNAAILNTADQKKKKNLISCEVLLIAGRCGAEVNDNLAFAVMRGWPRGAPPPFLPALIECSREEARHGCWVGLRHPERRFRSSCYHCFFQSSLPSVSGWPAEQRILSAADTRSPRSRSSVGRHQLRFLLLDIPDPSPGYVSLPQPDCGSRSEQPASTQVSREGPIQQ